jgi:hypothetical protein
MKFCIGDHRQSPTLCGTSGLRLPSWQPSFSRGFFVVLMIFDFFADFFAAFFGIAFLAFGTRKSRMQPGHNGLRGAKRDMTPSW